MKPDGVHLWYISDKIDSLKYQMSIKPGCRDKGIRKSENLVPFRDQVFNKTYKNIL